MPSTHEGIFLGFEAMREQSIGQVLSRQDNEAKKIFNNLITPHEKDLMLAEWIDKHFTSVKDLSACAQDCGVSQAKVWHFLNEKDLIKGLNNTEYLILNLFLKYSYSLDKAADETGLSVLAISKILEKFNIEPNWKKVRESRYSRIGSQKGMEAEALFKKLVPDALDANEEIKEGNSKFDFVVFDEYTGREKTVDVKEFAIQDSVGGKGWVFRFPEKMDDRADYYVLFLCFDKEKRLEGEYRVLVLPKGILPENEKVSRTGQKRLLISNDPNKQSYQMYFKFEISPENLTWFFTGEM